MALRRAAVPALALLTTFGLMATGASAATAASAATVADPVPARKAPSTVEVYSPYLPQVSCDPSAKPGTAALRSLLLSTYGGRDLGVTRGCDVGGLSEHKEGRAFDWGLDASVPAEKAVAQQFLDWLLADGPGGGGGYNARRLGVMYVIWNGRIWGSYRASDGWRPYSGAEAHADHLHISLAWNGAMERTSWWTGKAAATDYGPCPSIAGELTSPYDGPRLSPCPTPTPVTELTGTPLLRRESTGPYVKQLQRILSVTPVSGYFGPLTDAALRAFQTSHGLYVSGKTYGGTWAALRSAISEGTPPTSTATTPTPAQPAAKGTPKYLTRLDHKVARGETLGKIAKHWRSSVSAIKAANKLRSDTIRTGQVLSIPVKSWLTKFSHKTIRKGNHNKTVRALQTAMRMPRKYRTGLFGDITKGYVNKVKRHYGWKPNGVAGRGVWLKLGA